MTHDVRKTLPILRRFAATAPLWALAVMLGLATATQAQTPATGAGSAPATTRAAVARPSTPIKPADCVTSQCHANIKAAAVVHSPVAANTCDNCHELTDPKKHTFAIRRQKAELCTYCHEFSVVGMPVVHKPVAQGECLGCHDPHGGATKALVREKTTTELCNRCHESVARGKKFLHGPVAQGACDACHPPHASRFPKLLDVVGSDMCLACHREFEPAIAAAKFQHKAMEKGCPQCHDAHGSNTPMDLKSPTPDLCLSCHDKLKAKIAGATVAHAPVMQDRNCMNCHTSHASNVGKLLSELPATGCLKCHDKPVKTPAGQTIAAVPEVANPMFVKHGEIKDGQCGSCHDVHGGQREMLLTKAYSPAFYQQFSLDNYALCFSCHDAQLAQTSKTSKATGFRNGDVNLHFIHANSGVRDKNCRACHLTHAGPDPRLIRTSLKYGKWNMPISFTKTPTGGTCSSGCHDTYAYDREHPVATTRPTTGPTSGPTTAVAPVTARAEVQEARIITWSATDIAGAAVKIPDAAGRATVLVLLSADDAANDQTLQRLHAAVPQAKDAQVIVVLGGPQAAARGATLAAAEKGKPAPWAVVVDAEHAASQALGVRGWPVVLVLRGDGLEVARLTGKAEFLGIKLAAYVELANGRIDDSILGQRVATPAVVEAGPATRAVRDLRVARALLDDGKPDQALAFLDRDAKTAAPSTEANVLRAQALIDLKRPDEAMKVLSRIPDSAVAPKRLELLRARVYIAQERWDWAKSVLEECVTALPESAEAHRLMGQVYEHEQNWAKAAEQYRLAGEKKGAGNPR